MAGPAAPAIPAPAAQPSPAAPPPPSTDLRRWRKSAPATPLVLQAGIALGASRRANRIRAGDLAEAAGVSRSWLGAIEAGTQGCTPRSALRLYLSLGTLIARRLAAEVPGSKWAESPDSAVGGADA